MLFLLLSITFFISFFHFERRKPLSVHEYSSWSETEECDERSEQLDNRPSMVVAV
ncbi:hypothetical protein Hanom_Chr09g00857931 [Helianthus anomalus]